MNLAERALRLGCYSGLAAVNLADDSYVRRFHNRDIADVSESEYLEVSVEIQGRLVGAGVIRPDEDPFEETVAELIEQLGEVFVRDLLR